MPSMPDSSLNLSASGDIANLGSGRRRASVTNAICISTRARFCPMLMYAVAETDVELFWVIDEIRIPVPGRKVHDEEVAGMDRLTTDVEVFDRHPIHLAGTMVR
jgi:hypothetical protein